MTPLHGIACFYDVGFGARAVSRKTPIYFIVVVVVAVFLLLLTMTMTMTITLTMTMTMTTINKKDNDNDNILETIETLFTFLTIEKNNLNIHSEPSIKSDRGQHSQYLTYNVSLYILHFTCSNTKVLLQWRRNECEDSACLPRSEHQLQPVSKVVAKWRACLPCQANCEFCFQNSSPIFRCACVRTWTSMTSLHISII